MNPKDFVDLMTKLSETSVKLWFDINANINANALHFPLLKLLACENHRPWQL